jgi:hypothetical protein
LGTVNVKQRTSGALGAELSAHYTCELEYPVPVRYGTADGRVVTLAHERADIVVRDREISSV